MDDKTLSQTELDGLRVLKRKRKIFYLISILFLILNVIRLNYFSVNSSGSILFFLGLLLPYAFYFIYANGAKCPHCGNMFYATFKGLTFQGSLSRMGGSCASCGFPKAMNEFPKPQS